MKLYCMKSPDGILLTATIDSSKQGVWYAAFGWVAQKEGAEWRSKYWKRPSASMASARRLGWQIVPVTIKEIKQ